MAVKPVHVEAIVRVTMEDGSVIDHHMYRIDMKSQEESGLVLRMKEEEPDELIVVSRNRPERPKKQYITLAIKGQLLPKDPDGPDHLYLVAREYPADRPPEPLPDTLVPEAPATSATRENGAASRARPGTGGGVNGAASPSRDD
jgi:hypothetical protein